MEGAILEGNEVQVIVDHKIASDKIELQQMEKREAELLDHIPVKGFAAATERVVLGDKIMVFSDSSCKLNNALARIVPRP